MIEIYEASQLKDKLAELIEQHHIKKFLEKRLYSYIIEEKILLKIPLGRKKTVYMFYSEKQNKLILFVPTKKLKEEFLIIIKERKEINETVYNIFSKILNEYYLSLHKISKIIGRERKKLFEQGEINFRLMEKILYELDDLEDYVIILRDNSKLLLRNLNYLDLFSAEIVQILDEIKELQEKIKFLVDLNIGIQQQKLNIRMEKLTIISTIFLPATLIASIYGMNFQFSVIPAWRHPFGFLIAILFIILSSVLTYIFIKKEYKRWT